MNCPNCGTYYEGSPKFCPNCGAPLQEPQPQQTNEQPNGQQYQQPNYQQPNYQQPNYQQPQGGYRAPIVNRSIALCIVLSIVTCGIYGIYWMIVMANDLNTASGRLDDTSGGMVFLLTLVTCGIYGWYWLYKAGEKVNAVHQYNGEAPDSSASVLYMLLGIFGLGIVSYALIQSELNKVAAA